MSRPSISKAARKPRKPVHFPRSTPHQVRIIGGTWKRTPLAVLDANGLRPTPDRVRETVFNWLGYFFSARWDNVACLDLFAGTGAFGFEAASRGAAAVTLVESSIPAVKQMETIRQKLKAEMITLLQGDALASAQRLVQRGGKFNVIFLDPPYHQDWLPKMLPVIVPLLADEGLVYLEAEEALDPEQLPPWLSGWQLVRADRAGAVHFHLLNRLP